MKNEMSKYRVDASLLERNPDLEAEFGIDDLNLYVYIEDDSLHVVGEIIAEVPPPKRFFMVLETYDTDEELLEVHRNNEYAGGYNIIAPQSFFNGFPFTIDIYRFNIEELSRLSLFPKKWEYEED